MSNGHFQHHLKNSQEKLLFQILELVYGGGRGARYSAYMHVCAAHACNVQGGQKIVGTSETKIMDGSELPCGFRHMKPPPQEKQQVFLTIEPSLQPLLALLDVGSDCPGYYKLMGQEVCLVQWHAEF